MKIISIRLSPHTFTDTSVSRFISRRGHEDWGAAARAPDVARGSCHFSTRAPLQQMPRAHAAKLQETLQKCNATRLLFCDYTAFNVQMAISDS